MRCVICKGKLAGRQTKYCSRRCKNVDTNHHHQSYKAQQARAVQRKIELSRLFGGKCDMCDYDRNYAALAWHHIDPEAKSFELDAPSLSNRSWAAVMAEAGKCRLLCANCHAEVHFPNFDKRRRQRSGLM